ncbi:hypothetical protein D9V37_18830 [Nocardioides mangrovicus]|uniref:Tetratricopeptide repeat protein n=1 Tax=Nocardioides mangrovicus TaxID=2478913 RepID=A0A3L8NYA9_9ACTN|nr:hypothetical protein [Nocardioides mangrovicus]RLV48135.1 hypothetical protein D9V37_18830 [Nocardioides mangrovicus]
MPSVADVEQALRVADALPSGEEQVAASERALSLATAVEGADPARAWGLEVQARINLVAAYDAALPGERELPHIAWLLSALGESTGGREDRVLSERQRFEILWESRFALVRTRRSSRIPLSVVRRIHGDVERRYRAEGVSPHLYAKHRALLARDVDSPEVLERWLRVWRESPRDELSDCEACDIAAEARFVADSGDLEGALARASELVEGRRACDDQPARLLGQAADWAARLGRVDAAEAYHRTGWLMVAGHPGQVSAMADHVMYLMRANRPGRGVRLALELVPLLTGRAADRIDDVDRMRGSAVVARALRAGRGHQLAPAVVAGLPLDTAIANFDAVARELAACFDERNDNRRTSQRLAALTRISPYRHLASVETRASDLLEVALEAPPQPAPASSVPLPGSALGYAAELLAASDAFDAARVVDLVNGWAAHREELLPVDDPLEHFSVAYLDRRALASDRAQLDDAFADALLANAAESARLSGSQPAVQRVEVEIMHRAALAGDETAWRRAEKLVSELAAVGELREAAAGLMTLSRNPDPKRGMAYALRASDLFARGGHERWQVTALQAAGYAGIWAAPDLAADLLRKARAMAVQQALPSLVVAVTATLAKLAWQRGDLDAAVAGYREAVAESAEVGVTDPAGLRSELCDVLLQAGDWEALVDEAHSLLDRLAPDDVLRRALAHRVLGLGLLETGNAAEAAEVLAPAVVALERAGDPLVAVTAWTLGRALLAAGRADLAVEHFETAAGGFRAQRRLADSAAAHEAAGAALAQASLGRPGQAGPTATSTATSTRAAEHLVAAARTARAVGDVHRMVSALRQLAGVQATAGRVNEALATLGSVIPEARSVPVPDDPPPGLSTAPLAEERLRGRLEHQAALVLIDGGRGEEAVPLLSDAVTLLGDHGDAEEAAAARAAWQRLTGRVWTENDRSREDRRRSSSHGKESR